MMILLAFFLVWVMVCIYFYRAQERFIYVPDISIPSLKRASAYPGQEVEIHPEDDPEMATTSWYFRACQGKGTILFFHGNNGNIETRTGWMQFALAAGWGLLMVGYRGYGGNPGIPSQAGLTHDGLSAYDWLVHEAGVPAAQIFIFGHSLGSAVACQIASQRPAKALGLMSPMTHMAHVAFDRYPFLPAPLLIKDQWRSIDAMDCIKCPLAIAYCDKDTTVRPKRSLQLYQAYEGVKELTLLPGVGHGEIALSGGPQVLVDFFERRA